MAESTSLWMKLSMAEPSTEGGWIVAPLFGKISRVPEDVRLEREEIANRYCHLLGLQLGFYLINFIASPGYIFPFINHPQARLWSLAIFCIEALLMCAHWHLAPISKVNRFFCYTTTALFGISLAIFLPLLGPAIVTIANAVGPCCFGH